MLNDIDISVLANVSANVVSYIALGGMVAWGAASIVFGNTKNSNLNEKINREASVKTK